MRRFVAALCLFSSLVLLAACSGETLAGSWQHDGKPAIYTFNEDFTMSIEDTQGGSWQGTYEIEDETNMLLVTVNGNVQSGVYEIKDKQLIITSPDSGSVVTMTRIKSD